MARLECQSLFGSSELYPLDVPNHGTFRCPWTTLNDQLRVRERCTGLTPTDLREQLTSQNPQHMLVEDVILASAQTRCGQQKTI